MKRLDQTQVKRSAPLTTPENVMTTATDRGALLRLNESDQYHKGGWFFGDFENEEGVRLYPVIDYTDWIMDTYGDDHVYNSEDPIKFLNIYNLSKKTNTTIEDVVVSQN